MKNSSRIIGTILTLALVTACTPVQNESENSAHSSSVEAQTQSQSNSEIAITRNVSYQGIVQPLGISIYMQGTHRLALLEGKFILLESETVDLNGYVGEQVEVFGDVRPTVEAGGIIMHVVRVSLVEEDTQKSEDDVTPGEEEQESSSSEVSSTKVSSFSSVSSNSSLSSVSSVPQISSQKSESEKMPEIAPLSSEMQSRVELMAKSELTVDQWTQKYCTDHIGFCIPVHRNWWFRSFGTTTSSLWHVEINSEDITALNQGVISIDLLSNSVAEIGVTDGQVRVRGSMVEGYRAWSDNRHFTISAPAMLQDAVAYLTQNLVELPSE